MTVLAVDLGTSAVKAIVWDPANGVIARGRAPVATVHPQPGFDEQDAPDWWDGVRRALDGLPLDDLSAVGLSSQRETFVCLDEEGRPLRPAILWSDGRAATPAARFDWLREHEPEVARRTRWLAAPKDYVLHRLVGRLVTDTTLASRTDVPPSLLPEIVGPRDVVGEFRGAPVVAGAGDRACEVLAVAASPFSPMVSWGTTANCSFLLTDPEAVPSGWRVSAHPDGGRIAEAGLSGAGSALAWLAERLAIPTDELRALAETAPPGANGVIVLPWLNGARAPWWRPDAEMTFVNTTASTPPADLARAIYEGVAHDLRRALALLADVPRLLHLAGGGANDPVWRTVLMGVTGLSCVLTAGSDAAAIGAAWLARRPGPRGNPGRLRTRVDKPLHTPDRELVATYAELSGRHDAAAAAALGSET